MADNMKHLFGESSEDEEAPAAQQQDDEDQPEHGDRAGPSQAAARGTMQSMFGSDDEDAGDEGPSARPQGQEDDDEGGDRGDERQRQYERRSGPPLLLEVPLHDVLGSEQIRLVRLSNILGLEPKAFDPTTFEAESTEYVDDMGRKRIKLKDQNTIRWRWAPGPDGETVRQSNARFVRWSNGSLQLWLGDEVLDAKEIDIAGDQNYAYVRHQQLIQGQGQLTKKMVLQPASLSSGFHKRLSAMVDKQHVRQNKVRATTTLVDPKKMKDEKAKAEEARIKDREKLVERQVKQMRKYSVPRPQARMTAAYLEEEEEDVYEGGEEGLAEDMGAAQRARMLQQRRGYDEEAEAEAERRLTSAKAGAPASLAPGMKRGRTIEESEDEEISEGEDEMKGFIVDEEEGAGSEEDARRQAPPAKKKRGAVVWSSEDED